MDEGTYTIGFSGSIEGMTEQQMSSVIELFSNIVRVSRQLGVRIEVHHGDAVGCDAQMHELARAMDVPIVIHPPVDDRLRAFCTGAETVLPEKPYLVRDGDIAQSDILIACPRQMEEVVRSGTWATIRYSRKNGKRRIIVFPDGSKGS